MTEDLPPTEAHEPTPSSDAAGTHGRFLPGVTLGERYRIVGLLGRGGMGEVYRADDLELGQSVALKFLPEKLAADPVALDRLRSEVRTARQIAHPNVCRVYDIGQADGHVFLSMEYVDGDDLSHVLRRLGPPSKDKSVEIARQLCLGLASAHENDVLHRDLKPANVMLDGRGRIRITDFGLAGFATELEACPQQAGTPAYMAPEQLESGKVSIRSDIYSLGLVLYELFTGKRAFEGKTLEELRRSRSASSIVSMQSHNESVDPAVESVILRCLEADPDERPASVYAVLAALPGGDPLAAALAAGETPSPDMVASARERGGLSPRWAVTLFAAVPFALAVVAWLLQSVTIAPARGPQELETVARQMVRELGHELPRAEASDLIPNPRYLTRHPEDEAGTSTSSPDIATLRDPAAWPPPYFYWYRASPVSLKPNTIHSPLTRLAEPLAAPPGSVTIVLGSNGRLVELEIVPPPSGRVPGAAADAVDWSTVLEQAGLGDVPLRSAAPERDVPAFCDEWTAFRVARSEESGGDYLFQVGAHRGRVVHAATVWDPGEAGLLEHARKGHLSPGSSTASEWFFSTVTILSALLALYNVRRGRGDRRGAVVYGVVVFVAYFLYDAANAHVSESGIGAFLAWMVFKDAGGHASLHGIQTALAYLAIEPYVRRIWPRALIGWARLARGQWRDPAVARETLIGIAAPLFGGVVVIGVARLLQVWADQSVATLLRAPEFLGDTVGLAAEVPHSVAVGMFWMMMVYFVLLLLRLVTRRDWATYVLAVILMAPVLIGSGSQGQGAVGFEAVAQLIVAAVLLLAIIALVIRVGLIAGIVFWFVFSTVLKIPLTFDMSTFYAPQAIGGVFLLLAVAAYGFWFSLAGQPLLRDVLGEASADRGAQ